MLDILQQPFPGYTPWLRQLAICFISGLLVFIIFYFLQPLQLNTLNAADQLKYALVYGSVTFGVLVVLTVVCPLFFMGLMQEKNWTVGKELLFVAITVLLIAAANLKAYQILSPDGLKGSSYGGFLLATLLIGALPIFVTVSIKQKLLLNRYGRQAQDLNNNLLPKPAIGDTAALLLTGDNHTEILSIAPNDLWLLTTADNYVNIIYRETDQLKNILFRSSLSKMEDQLRATGQFVRCHRSYIVNLHQVYQVQSSAQGLKLQLKHYDQLIPVGKTYLELIKKQLHSTQKRAV